MVSRIRSTLARGRDRRGQSLVEFAVILPIFVLILVGVFDLGRAVYATSTLNNAAREAGRLAIVDQTPAHIKAEAIKQAVALGLNDGDVTITYRDPSTPNDVTSCPVLNIGCVVDVRIDYTFNPATPMIEQLVGHIKLNGETEFAIESLCTEPAQAVCPPGS